MEWPFEDAPIVELEVALTLLGWRSGNIDGELCLGGEEGDYIVERIHFESDLHGSSIRLGKRYRISPQVVSELTGQRMVQFVAKRKSKRFRMEISQRGSLLLGRFQRQIQAHSHEIS